MDLNSHTEFEHCKIRKDSNQQPEKTKAETPTASKYVEEDNVNEIDVDVEVEKQPNLSKSTKVPEVVCPFCRLMSKNIHSLKIHIENVHNNPSTSQSIDTGDIIISNGNETISQCPHCDFLGTRGSIENHISKKHGYVIICGECGNTFPDTKTCEDHIEAAHLIPQECEPFPCDRCGLVLANFYSLQDHIKSFHANKSSQTITCEECKIIFYNLPSLEEHQRNNHSSNEPTQVKCMQCNLVAENTEELKLHKQMKHQTVKVDIFSQDMDAGISLDPYCSQCDYECKLNIQLLQHIRKKNAPVMDQKFKCSSCAFQSNFLLKMYEHGLSEHPETPINAIDIRAYHHNKKFSNKLVGVFFKVLRDIEINVRKCVLAENAFFLSNFCASFC